LFVCACIGLTQTAGGVILPESGVRKNEGEVIAVGPGALDRDGNRRAVAVAIGETVLLPEYGGHTVKLGEEEFQLFRDEDILGKFESD
jgi:chaperonin GroES